MDNQQDNDLERLVGKTIARAEIKDLKNKGFDDKPYLVITLTDGSQATIEANYGSYTGKSEDEYPRFVSVNFKDSEA